ncbi:hypothetical protein PYW08_015686 [Mythimna loreyi]|uniref:Uncharacterized protein n=1 Tax=Mythimna loreyi TaxID=667449 RepID=A0ACC2QSF4_9NEOP|nr:hypothetical protein PYW08_015686 [Mythimna loreyi]
MDKCQYTEVSNNCESANKQNRTEAWKPFLRQLLISSGIWTSMFLYGVSVGAPTVFIPQIRKEANNTDIITDDMASWITSMDCFSGFPFVLILSILTRLIGRKIPFIIAALDTLAAFTEIADSIKGIKSNTGEEASNKLLATNGKV